MTQAMVFQLVCGVLLLLAGLLNVAVICSPNVPNGSDAKHSSRKVMAGAMLMLGVYLVGMATAGTSADRVMTILCGLIALAQVASSLIKIFPEEFGHHADH